MPVHTRRETPTTQDAMDDAIDAWHAAQPDAELPLHEWLGMTWAEYKRWVEAPAALPRILAERAPR